MDRMTRLAVEIGLSGVLVLGHAVAGAAATVQTSAAAGSVLHAKRASVFDLLDLLRFRLPRGRPGGAGRERQMEDLLVDGVETALAGPIPRATHPDDHETPTAAWSEK